MKKAFAVGVVSTASGGVVAWSLMSERSREEAKNKLMSSRRIMNLTATVVSMSFDYFKTMRTIANESKSSSNVNGGSGVDLDEQLRRYQKEIEQVTIRQMMSKEEREKDEHEETIAKIRKDIDKTCDQIVKKREAEQTNTTQQPSGSQLMSECHARSAKKLRDMVDYLYLCVCV